MFMKERVTTIVISHLGLNCLLMSHYSHKFTGYKFCMGYSLKRQSRLQQTTNFATSFLIFRRNKVCYHENCLPADNSHEISCLICYF